MKRLLLLSLMSLFIAGYATGGELIPFEKFTLSNGLTVLLHVDRKIPIVHVNSWFHVGSKNEEPGRTGFAHLFEHMMFQGSKNAPGEYFSWAEKAGANLREGGVNGTTDLDRTNYFITAPAGNLEYLLWLESDRLATLLDELTQEKLDNQREVVRNERRQGMDNVPYGRFWTILFEELFPAGHPYSWPVIGSHRDLEAATLEDVRAFFRRYYSPNNLSLCITGDFEPQEARRLVEKYYGPIPPGPSLPRHSRWVPALPGEKILTVEEQVPQAKLHLVWPVPPGMTSEEAALNAVATILTDGVSSRLYRQLVHGTQKTSEVSSHLLSAEIAGLFIVMATLQGEASFAEVQQLIDGEIQRLCREGPTPEELSRFKAKVEFGVVADMERIGGFGGKADLLNRFQIYAGDPAKYLEERERYRNLTAGDVKKAADIWLNHKNRLVVRFVPTATAKATPATLDRTAPPVLSPDKPFTPPGIQEAVLDNGLTLLVVERPELPKVSVSFLTRAGSMFDPTSQSGLAKLVIDVLPRGTKTLSSTELDEAFANLGTRLSREVTQQVAILGFDVLKAHVGSGLALLADIVRNPTFPESEVGKARHLLVAALERELADPVEIATRLASQLYFGKEHPLGQPINGSIDTLASCSSSDIVQFHKMHYTPSNSVLVFSGDITLQQATEAAKRALGSWQGGKPPLCPLPEPTSPCLKRIFLVDRPDAPQTVIYHGTKGISWKHPDFFSLVLGDAVYGGGGFGTRLMLNLREEKGYTYRVFSGINAQESLGLWYAGGAFQGDKTLESIQELRKEFEGLSGPKPITAPELTGARIRYLRGFSQRFETTGKIAEKVGTLWTLNQPLNRWSQEWEGITKASLEEVNATLKTLADPEKSFFVLVGDAEKLLKPLRQLKIGEVILLDKTGNKVETAPDQ